MADSDPGRSCPGPCPPNAGLILDRSTQPSCGLPPVNKNAGLCRRLVRDVCKVAQAAKEATTTHHPRGESPTFITALNDAYLVPRDDLYAIFWRTAGRDLCRVEPAVAEEALRGEGEVVRLGSWSGAIHGRQDEWTLWWWRGLSWAATSDVADGDQTLRLIEHWRAEAARAEARGQRWDPSPP
jgi:hypothetical protein